LKDCSNAVDNCHQAGADGAEKAFDARYDGTHVDVIALCGLSLCEDFGRV